MEKRLWDGRDKYANMGWIQEESACRPSFFNLNTGVRVVVHGDGFTCAGVKDYFAEEPKEDGKSVRCIQGARHVGRTRWNKSAVDGGGQQLRNGQRTSEGIGEYVGLENPRCSLVVRGKTRGCGQAPRGEVRESRKLRPHKLLGRGPTTHSAHEDFFITGMSVPVREGVIGFGGAAVRYSSRAPGSTSRGLFVPNQDAEEVAAISHQHVVGCVCEPTLAEIGFERTLASNSSVSLDNK